MVKERGNSLSQLAVEPHISCSDSSCPYTSRPSDLAQVDDLLPMTMFDSLQTGFSVLSAFLLVAIAVPVVSRGGGAAGEEGQQGRKGSRGAGAQGEQGRQRRRRRRRSSRGRLVSSLSLVQILSVLLSLVAVCCWWRAKTLLPPPHFSMTPSALLTRLWSIACKRRIFLG